MTLVTARDNTRSPKTKLPWPGLEPGLGLELESPCVTSLLIQGCMGSCLSPEQQQEGPEGSVPAGAAGLNSQTLPRQGGS